MLTLDMAVFFDRARERARKLDREFAATGKLKGILHGVPVSPILEQTITDAEKDDL